MLVGTSEEKLRNIRGISCLVIIIWAPKNDQSAQNGTETHNTPRAHDQATRDLNKAPNVKSKHHIYCGPHLGSHDKVIGNSINASKVV